MPPTLSAPQTLDVKPSIDRLLSFEGSKRPNGQGFKCVSVNADLQLIGSNLIGKMVSAYFSSLCSFQYVLRFVQFLKRYPSCVCSALVDSQHSQLKF